MKTNAETEALHKKYFNMPKMCFPYLPQTAQLGSTSLRRFKIYQPVELEVLNISSLMEARFSLLLTIMAIQAP